MYTSLSLFFFPFLITSFLSLFLSLLFFHFFSFPSSLLFTFYFSSLLVLLYHFLSYIILYYIILYYIILSLLLPSFPFLLPFFSSTFPGTFTLLGCLISLWHLTSHLRHYYKPDVQRRVMAVLWMVPIYSITSWLSLVFPRWFTILHIIILYLSLSCLF